MDVELIHPMIVHFPIVLWLLAVVCQFAVVLRGEQFAARQSWQRASLWLLVLGCVAGAVAAGFGDLAKDVAMDKGFPERPIESHEEMATSTLTLFIILTLVQGSLFWRKIKLKPLLSWALPLAGLVGCALLLVTAFYGGSLVYDLGVNVSAISA